MLKFSKRLHDVLAVRIAGEGVTLALDGGKVHRKLQSLSVIVGGKAFYLTSFTVCNFHLVDISHILLLIGAPQRQPNYSQHFGEGKSAGGRNERRSCSGRWG